MDELANLIEQVEKVNVSAAEYLRAEAKNLPSWAWGGESGNTLSTCMIWDDTPQGHEYWENIADNI